MRVFRSSLLLFSLLVTGAFAQESKDFTAKFQKADNFLAEEQYEKALPLFLELVKADAENANLNYKTGLCYFFDPAQKAKSLPYFEKAAAGAVKTYNPNSPKEKNAPEDAFYMLAQAYHITYKFDQAIEKYELFKSKLGKLDETLLKKVDRQIQECKNGKEMMAKPVTVTVKNLGNVINSPYPDYAPVISADQSTLIFTSRRPGGITNKKDADSLYYEDIYMSTNDGNGNWSPAKLMPSVNNEQNNASIALSPDGQRLFVYVDEMGDGNIYSSMLTGETWAAPAKLGSDINSKSWEPSVTITADGKTLYFVSDRKGGFGGRDIYRCVKLPSGEWGLAQNLGPAINTPFDEDAPFISLDEKTLYFSSNGHKGMGGFDIYSSTFFEEENTWSPPQNIGYPINTPEDDIFFVTTPDEKSAYYASAKDESTLGEKDIYLVNFPEKKATNITVVIGLIINNEGPEISPDIEIRVSNINNPDDQEIFRPNIKTGKYIFALAPGNKYSVVYLLNETLLAERQYEIPASQGYQEMRVDPVRYGKPKPIDIQDATPVDDKAKKDDKAKERAVPSIREELEQIKLRNVFFPSGMSTLSPAAKKDLDKVARFLIRHPEITCEIQGHCDASGSAELNRALSEKRAAAVREYLIKQGVEKEQLISKGYGEDSPIAINQNDKGNWVPKGMQFNRRFEFKLNIPNQQQYIIPIDVPADLKIESKPKSE